MRDVSITDEELHYGIEIISPIFNSDFGVKVENSVGPWQSEIEKVWALTEKYFEVVTEYRHQCGTHIHVSPPTGYSTDLVLKFARFLTLLDDTITDTVPKKRRESTFARPNFDVRPKPSLEVLTHEKSLDDLVNLMMPRDEDLNEGFPDQRYVAWNFLPLQSGKGTIEFRQPPHVKNFKEAENWIQLTLYLFFRGLHWSH